MFVCPMQFTHCNKSFRCAFGLGYRFLQLLGVYATIYVLHYARTANRVIVNAASWRNERGRSGAAGWAPICQ